MADIRYAPGSSRHNPFDLVVIAVLAMVALGFGVLYLTSTLSEQPAIADTSLIIISVSFAAVVLGGLLAFFAYRRAVLRRQFVALAHDSLTDLDDMRQAFRQLKERRR